MKKYQSYKLVNKLLNNRLLKNIKNKYLKRTIIHEYIKRIENELYINYDYDDSTIRYKLIKLITEIILCDIAILIAAVIIYGLNLQAVFIFVFLIFVINQRIVTRNIDVESKKILYQLPDLIDEIKSAYYEKRMVATALKDASMNVNYEISQKCEKMIEVLESSNLKVEVEKYNRECSNRFLKLLMNILFLTKEYGDNGNSSSNSSNSINNNSKEKNESILIKNLNYLLEEINIEIVKQNLFDSKFQGLIFTSIFPLAFINLIEIWSVKNFEILSEFYNSFAGFILKNVSVIVTILISILIIKIKKSECDIESEKKKFNVNENDKNQKMQTKILKKIIPNEKSREYQIMQKKFEDMKLSTSPYDYIKSKITTFIFANLMIGTTFIFANRYLKSISFKTLMVEIIITIVLALCSTFLVDFNLDFERRIKKNDAINEINNFRCIILILSQYSFVSAEEILIYLEKYSYVYKNVIKRCLNDYESNNQYALLTMKNEVKEKEFKKIIRCLLQCAKNIKVSEAFEFLETEREFYKEEMKNKNADNVNKKTNLAQMLSMIPYYTLIVLYFITPMTYTGINQLTEMIAQIKNL